MSTKSKPKCFTLTWTIENISYHWQKNGECIRSPTFVINAQQELKYFLALTPTSLPDDDYISFHLHEEGNRYSKELDYEFAFLSKDGSVLTSQKFENGKNCSGFEALKERKEVFFDNRSAYLPEDKLTVRCRIWKIDEEMKEDVQLIARTRICIEKDSFLWDIKNFSRLHSEEKCTHQIKSVLDNKLLLTLDLLLKNPYTDDDSITIQLASENGSVKYCVLYLTPLNGSGRTNKGIRKEFLFSDDMKPKLFTLPFSKKDLIANKDLWLPNDVLSFQCECVFSTGKIVEEIERVIYDLNSFPTNEADNLCMGVEKLSVSKRALDESLKSLFHDNILSDIKLKTSSKTFPAHKSILSARSPVFKAMFSKDSEERSDEHGDVENNKYIDDEGDECVDIENFDSDIVHRMLHYIYTAEIQDLQWEKACQLYRAADKYEILALRYECSAYLKSNLRTCNACKILVFADAHKDEDLEASIQNFIFNNNVINSEEWKWFMERHVKLAADTMYLQIQRKTLNWFITTQTGNTKKFNPPIGRDSVLKEDLSTSIETNNQCITRMKENGNKSLEELRSEHYANKKEWNNIGLGTSTQQTSIFGAPATTTSDFSLGGKQSEILSCTFGNKSWISKTTPAEKTILNPPIGTDEMFKGVNTAVETIQQCITTMKEYNNKILEELRSEHYAKQKELNTIGSGTPTQQTSIFGAPATTTSDFSLGRKQSEILPCTFDNKSFIATTTTTGKITKFNPPIGIYTMLKRGVHTAVATRQQCITAMKEYENKSMEELRREHYTNKKELNTIGLETPTQQTSTFGAPATTTSDFSLDRKQSEILSCTFGNKSLIAITTPIGLIAKFNPPIGIYTMLKGGVHTAVATRQQCITTMKEYENKSLEELRSEHYDKREWKTIGLGTPTQQTSTFGAPATTTSDFSLDEKQSEILSNTTGLIATTTPTGKITKFNPPIGIYMMLKGGVYTAVKIRQQCITTMKEYENKSLEELRSEYYAKRTEQNPFGLETPTQQTSIFGAPATTQLPTSL